MYKNMYDKMNIAYLQAEKAAQAGEIPVGCAIFYEDELISSAHNLSEKTGDMTDHAEIIAMKEAVKILGRKKIKDAVLFVTLEPCPMCAGAMIHMGIKNIYFASFDKNFGAYEGFTNLFSHPYAKGINVYGGIMEDRCTALLKAFFEDMRKGG